jgi:hypothetical protein
MTEHDAERPENAIEGEADVEAHGLKEAAVAGMSAAALIAGAGNAVAANAPEAKAPAKHATIKGETVNKFAADPTHKVSAVDKTVAADATFKLRAVDKTNAGAAMIKYDLKGNKEA